MSKQHHAAEGDFSNITFFGACKPKFLPTQTDDKIPTAVFLEASRQILPFLDKLGKAFSLVRKDIQGNIEKINKQYTKDPEKYAYINAILEEDSGKKDMSDACIGVLWLKRALDFIHCIFKEILIEARKGEVSENLTPAVNRAYETSLKRYHGWVTQKIFGGVSHFVPSKKDFLNALILDPSATTETVLRDIELYDVNLSANIELLDKLLTLHNKNPQEAV